MTSYRRLAKFIKPYWRIFLLSLAATIIVSLMEGATAWLIKPVIDDIFIKKDSTMLLILTVAIFIVYFIKGIFRYISSYSMSYVGMSIVTTLRNIMYDHIHTLSISFFKENKTGDVLTRIVQDTSVIQGMVSISIKDLMKESITMVVLLAVLFIRDSKLAAYSLFILPLSVYLMSLIGRKLRKLGRHSQEKIADINNLVIETFSGIKIIKAFSREPLMTKRFFNENGRFFTILKKTIKYREITSPSMEVLGAVGISFILWYAGGNVIRGTATTGNFFSFLTALLMLYSPIRRLSNINNSIQHASASVNRIFELIDTKTTLAEKSGAVRLSPFSDRIEFISVYFSYSMETVLHNINLSVKKGETVAIVGESGAGKTTILDLIPRFYDVCKGKILIDGTDIKDVTLASLRSNIGVVTQDTFLFNDSIGNNILFGNPDASTDDMISASKAAYAHNFISSLPEKYNTMAGERGVRLSGGQRQRIAIARALIKDPDIMILDEATSALDTESEKIVQRALDNLMKNRTTIVVAHRLSTILHADKIIVIDKGKIVEQGRHEDLITQAGQYKKIFDMQFACL